MRITPWANGSCPLYNDHLWRRQVWEGDRTALLSRTKFVGGDFFQAATIPEAEPADRDVYVMRAVLHDWPDKEAQQILADVRTAIGVLGVLDAIAEAACAGCRIHWVAAEHVGR